MREVKNHTVVFLLVFLELEKLLFGKFYKLNSQAMQNEATWLQEGREPLKKKNQTQKPAGGGRGEISCSAPRSCSDVSFQEKGI